jgi:hypothetical protein
MTPDYTKVASYDIRKVLWQELQNAKLFNEQDYYADGFFSPLVPIIPTQQVPEFNNLLPGKPYLTYDILQRHGGVQWWMQEEMMSFGVTSTDENQIQTVINFMIDLFRRYDQSAKEINLELVSDSPFTFHFFHLESADPVQPFKNEGGFMTGLISIVYSYSREADGQTGRYL